MDCSEPTSPGADLSDQTPRRRLTEKKRRVVTNSFFDELVVVLSLIRGPECENPRKLDKVSILQQTRNVVKFFHELSAQDKNRITNFTGMDDTVQKIRFLKTGALFELFMDSLNGFVLVVMSSGRIVHASANTICTLGCRPSIVIGQHTSSWMHQEDAMRVFRPLPHCDGALTSATTSRFPCRFRLQGANDSMGSQDRSSTSSQFLAYQCNVYNRNCTVEESDGDELGADFSSIQQKNDFCKIVVASSNSLAYRDAPIPTDESDFCYELRITREGKILSISSHSALALGFTESEIIGSSIFDFVYPYHVTAFGQSISLFLKNGYGATNPYRILTKGGQWVWCVTRGFIGCNPWSNAPDHILLHMKVIGTDRVNPQQRKWTNFTYLPDNSIFTKADVEDELFQRTSSSVAQSPRSPGPASVASKVATPPVANPQSQSPSQSPQTAVPNATLKSQTRKPSISQGSAKPQACNSRAESSGTFVAEKKMEDKVKKLEKELSSKNAELFESQTRLLEQQNLLSQERKRFFELTETLVKRYNPPVQNYPTQQFQQPAQKYNFLPNSDHQTPKWHQQEYSSAPSQPYQSTEMPPFPPTSTEAYCPLQSAGTMDEVCMGEMNPEAKNRTSTDSVANMLAKLMPDSISNIYGPNSFPTPATSLASQSNLPNPFDAKSSTLQF